MAETPRWCHGRTDGSVADLGEAGSGGRPHESDLGDAHAVGQPVLRLQDCSEWIADGTNAGALSDCRRGERATVGRIWVLLVGVEVGDVGSGLL